MNRGLVHLYYGDGKGKTTAAAGLALRAYGAGFPVLFVQFLKDGHSSEVEVLRTKLGIPVLAGTVTTHMTFEMTRDEKIRTGALLEEIWQSVLEWTKKGPACDSLFSRAGEDSPVPEISETGRLLVLDEILAAIETGLFPEEKLVRFLDGRPNGLEVVLTGRNPSLALIDRSDYRSQIVCAGHPYDRGIIARKGIEF